MDSRIREALKAIIESRDMLSGHYREYDRAARLAREALALLDAPVETPRLIPIDGRCPGCGTVILDTGYGAHHSADCLHGGKRFELDAPVASDARELAGDIVDDVTTEIQGAIGRTTKAIESFAAERERKAREETALICAETYCNICKRQNRTMSCGPNLKCTIYHAIKEALNE